MGDFTFFIYIKTLRKVAFNAQLFFFFSINFYMICRVRCYRKKNQFFVPKYFYDHDTFELVWFKFWLLTIGPFNLRMEKSNKRKKRKQETPTAGWPIFISVVAWIDTMSLPTLYIMHIDSSLRFLSDTFLFYFFFFFIFSFSSFFVSLHSSKQLLCRLVYALRK